MRHEEAKQIVSDLTGRLYHELSANILVFLAHLSDDPVIIGSMRSSAAALFPLMPLATIEGEDVAGLNALHRVRTIFELPKNSPELNRKLIGDARDERAAKRGRNRRDGREIDPVPSGEREEMHESLDEIRAALKTIGSSLFRVGRFWGTSPPPPPWDLSLFDRPAGVDAGGRPGLNRAGLSCRIGR